MKLELIFDELTFQQPTPILRSYCLSSSMMFAVATEVAIPYQPALSLSKGGEVGEW